MPTLFADVVCATCISSGHNALRKKHFSLVVVDECTQATEPSCLIPITKALHHVVLVGR